MGTKGGKPLSALEKRQKRAAKKEEVKKAVKKEERKETRISAIDESLCRKVLEDINNSGYTTLFTIAQKFGIKISLAKKIIKELINRNEIALLAKNRRVMIVARKQ